MKTPGRVILYSTHHMDEVQELCDRVLILHQGRLLAKGTTAEVPAQLGCRSLSEIFAKYADHTEVEA
jgi:ABC-type Na+ transport system ATPase subunit NatA